MPMDPKYMGDLRRGDWGTGILAELQRGDLGTGILPELRGGDLVPNTPGAFY